jgi:hypothetical protein
MLNVVHVLLLRSAERLKLEKDYLELQSKAFAAPGSALAEVKPDLLQLSSCDACTSTAGSNFWHSGDSSFRSR